MLTDAERAALDRGAARLPLAVTPYYASLIPSDQPDDPLRKTVIPRPEEGATASWESTDPLGEEAHAATPGLIHTYPCKVLWLVTDQCATYCRYCTRSRWAGGGCAAGPAAWGAALEYIAAHPEIHDVLLSGGDPLILSTARLDWLLSRLRAIPHVELVRIGTKVPAVLPQRITTELVTMLRRHHPLWMSLHLTHPRELTPEVETACGRLADAGIPLQAQTVLLRGVNDDEQTLRALLNGMLRLRVKPYYLHQCDAAAGTAHFKVPVERGLELVRGLHGRMTGYAVPHYMIDAPGGGGKVPIAPAMIDGRQGDDLLLHTYNGRVCRYPDPVAGERIDSTTGIA